MNPPPALPQVPVAAAIPPVKLDAAGNIAEDITCRRCAYNLRSLSPMGRCPECGTAVGRSLHGDFLRFSDPEWVQKLASGMNWIVAAIVIGILAGLIITVVASISQLLFGTRWVFLILPGFQYAMGLIGLIGYWKVTSPDPGATDHDSPTSARRLVRITQTANYVVGPVQTLLQMLGSWIAVVPAAVDGLCGVVGTIAIFVYGRKLAMRIPDDKTARDCRIVMWGLSVTSLVAAVFGILTLARLTPVVTPLTTTTSAPGTVMKVALSSSGTAAWTTTMATTGPATMTTTVIPIPGGSATTSTATGTATTFTGGGPFGGTPGGTAGFAGIACFTGLGFLIFGLWSLRILLRMRKALNEAAEQARATWARAPQGTEPTMGRPIPPAP